MDIHEYNMHALHLYYVTMTEYDESYRDVHVVYQKDKLANTIGEVIANKGLTQLRIAETEKYPHVTFFFSGGREANFVHEERILIPSPKVATYDLQPEMSANEITSAVCAAIKDRAPDFICLNYANTDMVGHTGDFKAGQVAAETVDKCLKSLVETALAKHYEIIVIADHGNSDYMINEDGSPNTAHTTNPVPIIYISKNASAAQVKNGKLGDIAPTLLSLMGVDKPHEMTGEVLVSF
jgi:2,3-bisphosphoglycerate-independent phosphoglycerate mutase